MKKWIELIIVLAAIALVVAFIDSKGPTHDPTSNITSVAQCYSGGGDLKIDGFHANNVMEATITSYEDGWQRIDFKRTDGSYGRAMIFKG